MGDGYYYGGCPPYDGGYGTYAGASEPHDNPGLDVFIKKAAEVKRILPSLFNIKVVRDDLPSNCQILAVTNITKKKKIVQFFSDQSRIVYLKKRCRS